MKGNQERYIDNVGHTRHRTKKNQKKTGQRKTDEKKRQATQTPQYFNIYTFNRC